MVGSWIFQICLNFCNGLTFHTNDLTFVVFKGYKLGYVVCTPHNPKPKECWLVSGYLWGISKLRVSFSVNLVLRHWVPGRIADEIWWKIRFLGKWVKILLYFSFSLYGLWDRKNNKSKIWLCTFEFQLISFNGKSSRFN